MLTAEQAQDLAVRVAMHGAGFVSPNPLVGCVIVDQEHRLLATGFHAIYGGPHAEADAFSKIDAKALRGSTVYVTLEPCSHHGKTPPCAELFLNKGIKKVVVGLQDPNTLVAGRGLALLKQNGIQVEMPEEFSKKCLKLAEIFLWHIQKKLPFVALKIALSSDDKIAGTSGKAVSVTGEEARRFARELRAGYDATMIGAQTFLNDDPLLDFRQTKWADKKSPKVVILDPHGRAQNFFPQSRMSRVVSAHNIFFVKTVDEDMLKDLYQKGIYSLYVEGGTLTHGLFIDKKLFQKLYCFRSSRPIGLGRPWVSSFASLPQKLQVVLYKEQSVGEDQFFVFYRDSEAQ